LGEEGSHCQDTKKKNWRRGAGERVRRKPFEPPKEFFKGNGVTKRKHKDIKGKILINKKSPGARGGKRAGGGRVDNRTGE